MAEGGPRSTGKDGSHPPLLAARAAMAHRVNAPMQTMEPSQSKPPRNPIAVDSALSKLCNRDNPELPRRDPSHGKVRWGTFLSHSESK